VLAALKSQSGLPTIWSGVAQLQFIPSNVVSSAVVANEPNQVSSSSLERTKPSQRDSSKRKTKVPKRSSQEKEQLEIDITTDESDDAADR
jgi:hypothetical protein